MVENSTIYVQVFCLHRCGYRCTIAALTDISTNNLQANLYLAEHNLREGKIPPQKHRQNAYVSANRHGYWPINQQQFRETNASKGLPRILPYALFFVQITSYLVLKLLIRLGRRNPS